MTTVGCSYSVQGRRFSAVRASLIVVVAWTAIAGPVFDAGPGTALASRTRPQNPMVLAQLPVAADLEKREPAPVSLNNSGGMLRAAYGERGRIVVVFPDASPRVLSRRFHSACDPEVSFDATRLLFAGKRIASDNWNIYEMNIDGSNLRQITRNMGDCRSPGYQSMLYTIVSPKPWYQITFVGTGAGTMNEYGPTVATHLYSCKLDGSSVRRLTFNLSSDMDPTIMSDGRLLFASWQRSRLDPELRLGGRVGLFGVNIDGTDFAAFSTDGGRGVKHMPCVTAGGLVVFVEAEQVPWDGAGYLSCVTVRRPLHSYRQITGKSDGLFHSPSPLPDGKILVSRRLTSSNAADGSRSHGVWRLDPVSAKAEPIFDDPRYHDIQARLIRPRPVPDGRSSVVTEKDPHGKLYCLNVYLSDLKRPGWMPPGTVKRLRVLEGVPLRTSDAAAYLPIGGTVLPGNVRCTVNGIPPLVQRRILGEIDVEADGSFNIEVPANTPIELQTLDANGMALRSCGWIWAKNHEPRGCIGCHEDGELTPENTFMDAVERPSIPLTLPPQRRRTVDFRRDVMPIITRKCAPCHHKGERYPHLDGGLELVAHPGGFSYPGLGAYFNRAYENLLALNRPGGHGSYLQYAQPGQARTSPLIWHVFGRNTSRPWDAAASQRPAKRMPPDKSKPLGDDEKRTLVEWIDMGALWDGIPATGRSATDDLPGNLPGKGKQ